MRKLSCSYLYTDGTLIEMYDEFRKDMKIGETVNVTLGYCKLNLSVYDESDTEGYRRKRSITGRIVFHSYDAEGVLAIAKGGTIDATLPSLINGSENSRSKGIKVQYVQLTTKSKLRFHWCDCDVVSSQFTLQEMAVEHAGKTITPGDRWGYASTIYSVRDMRPMQAA